MHRSFQRCHPQRQWLCSGPIWDDRAVQLGDPLDVFFRWENPMENPMGKLPQQSEKNMENPILRNGWIRRIP